MEELMLKYIFGDCTSEEKLLFEKQLLTDTALRVQYEALLKVDNLFTVGQPLMVAPDGSMINKITSALHREIEEKDFSINDFVLPIVFVLGSILYSIYQYGSTISVYLLPTLSESYSTAILLAILCIFGLLFLDNYLSGKNRPGHQYLCV